MNQVRTSSSALRVAFVLAIATFVGISSYLAAQQAGLLHSSSATAAKTTGSSKSSMTAAAATASMQSGGNSAPAAAGSAVAGPGSVTVGALKFPYDVDWRPADQGSMPSRMHGAADIRIFAGLQGADTPAKASASRTSASAAAGVGMTYLLFGKGRQFPELSKLESTFDAGFADAFPGFAKVSAERKSTVGAVPYLRYEFTYVRDGQQYREIVAAYSTRHQGIITVSSGTEASISGRLAQIDKVISSATLA